MNQKVSVRRVTVALACALGVPLAHGATWDWNNATALWSGVGSWTPDTIPISAMDTLLRFGGTGSAPYVSTSDFAGPFLLHGIELNSAATVTETISASGGGTLSFLNDGATDPAITQKGSGAFDITLGIDLTNKLTLNGTGTGFVNLGGVITGGGGLIAAAGNWRLTDIANSFTGGVTVNTGAFLELAPAGTAPQSVNITVGGASILGGNAAANAVTLNGGTLKLTTSGAGSMVFGAGRAITFGGDGGILDLVNTNTTNPNAQGGHITGGDLNLTVTSAATTPAIVRFNGGQFGLTNNSRTDGNWSQANNALRFSGFSGTGTLRIELTNGAMLRAGNGGGSPQNIALTTIWRGVVGGDPTSGPLGTTNTGISTTTGRVVVDVNEEIYQSVTLEGALQIGATGASRALSGTIVIAGTASGAPGYVDFTGRGTGTQLSSTIQAPGGSAAGQNPLWLMRNNNGSLTIQDGGIAVFDPRSRADTGGTNGNGVAMDGQLIIQGGGTLAISQSVTNFTPGVAATNANAGDVLVYGDITGTGSTNREAVFSIALPAPQPGSPVPSAIPASLTGTATIASERPYGGLVFDDTRGTANFIVNGTGFGGLRVNGVPRPTAQLSSTGAVGGAPMADPVGADVKVAAVLTAARLSRLAGSGGYLTVAPQDRTFTFPLGGDWADAVPVGLKVVDHRAAGTDVSFADLNGFRHNVAIDAGASLDLGAAAPFVFDNNMTLHGKGTVLSGGSVTIAAGSAISPGLNDLGTLALTTGTLTISGNLRMDVTPASADLLALTGNLALDGTLALSGSYGTQEIILASYSGTLAGTFANVTGLSPAFSVDYGTGANSVIKLVYNTNPTRVWNGLPGATWTVGGGNWKNGETFVNTNRARFDGTAAGSTTVTISGSNVEPLETLVHTDTKDYTIISSAGAALAGAGSLTKTGTMILNLLGPATYAGGTFINEGTVALGTDNALPDLGLISIAAGAKLDTKGHTETVADINVAGSVVGGGSLTVNSFTLSGDASFTPNLITNGNINKVAGSGTLAVPIDFNGGIRDISVDLGSTFTITGPLANGGYNKTGPGDLVVAPVVPNVYAGGTTVAEGKLIAQAGAIPIDSALTISSGATLEAPGPQPLILSSLTGNGGTFSSAGGVTLNQFSTTTFAGSFTGNTAVTMSGPGQITLSGASTYSGGLAVNSGRVILSGPGAGGTGIVQVNPGGALGSGAALSSRVHLLGGTLFGVGSPPASIASNDLVAGAGTVSTISLNDPQNAGVRSEMRIQGTLKGSGNLNVVISTNAPHPDGGVGFRLLGTSASDFSGTITMGQSTKFEVQTGQAGPFSPAGTGKLVFTAGDFFGGLNGNYSQFNVRSNFAGTTVIGNDVEVTGTGFVNMNMAGSGGGAAVVGSKSVLGNLRIGNQTLGVNKNGTPTQILEFTSVTLTSGDATFAPTTPNFGASGAGDLRLGPISELVPGSGIILNGGTILTLAGANTYTGTTRVDNGTLLLAAAGALPVTGALVVNGGTVDFAPGFVGLNQTIASLSGTAGTITNTDQFSTRSIEVAQTISTEFGGSISGNLAFRKTGAGELVLTGAVTSGDVFSVEGGAVKVKGTVTAPIVVKGGGNISGSGILGRVDVQSGGLLTPGDFGAVNPSGVLTASEVTFTLGSAMDVSIAKAITGAQPVSTDYGSLKITGSVDVTGSDLDLSLGSGIENGDIFTIILNEGPSAVVGNFFGRANGDIFARGGRTFQISYFDDAATPGVFELAGGNDVSLIAVPEPGTVAFLLGGLALMAGRRRRQEGKQRASCGAA